MDTTGPGPAPETPKIQDNKPISRPQSSISLPPAELFGSPNETPQGFNGREMLAKLFNQTRAYIPEYAVLLIVTGSLVGLVNGLFSSSIDYIGSPKPHSSWGGGWQYTASLGMLAATLVLIPALVALTRRIKGTEGQSTSIKNLGWRRGFLGLFLVIIILIALGYAIALVYQLVSQIAGAGLVTANKAVWKTYIKDIFAVLLFGTTSWLYTRDYRYTDNDNDQKHQMLAKLHRYGLTLMAIVLVIVFCMTTLTVQRNDYIDSLISEDISAIHTKISDFETQKSQSVSSLSDLKLSDEVKDRITKYSYEYNKTANGYKLCAVFKTDTSTKNGSQDNTALEQALSNISYGGNSTTVDPSVHDKGRVCFDYVSLGGGSSNPYPLDSTSGSF